MLTWTQTTPENVQKNDVAKTLKALFSRDILYFYLGISKVVKYQDTFGVQESGQHRGKRGSHFTVRRYVEMEQTIWSADIPK